ncbi:hypothetical protein E2C01_038485 [Portunus trituberculatus]|uniref:Uncharacterized protein n=1 Tax=Portunus trituberculatus TaxID=210409 RepID=A0A5B7FK90_PORTR|nr:hypothetical protein [Portunus trituberculatus]
MDQVDNEYLILRGEYASRSTRSHNEFLENVCLLKIVHWDGWERGVVFPRKLRSPTKGPNIRGYTHHTVESRNSPYTHGYTPIEDIGISVCCGFKQGS